MRNVSHARERAQHPILFQGLVDLQFLTGLKNVVVRIVVAVVFVVGSCLASFAQGSIKRYSINLKVFSWFFVLCNKTQVCPFS
jgi:hypothetical protein